MLIATYNIQWGKGRDGRVDLGRIAQTVRAADIIALQEVERGWRPDDYADQIAALGALLPDRYLAFGVAVDIDGSRKRADGSVENRRRQYGNLVLSRWPLAATRSFPLTKYPVHGHVNDASVLLETVVAHPTRPFRLYNTHLNYLSQRQRQIQVCEVLRVVADAPAQGGPVVGPGAPDSDFGADWMAMQRHELPDMPTPAFLVGDFNMRPTSPEYAMITGPAESGYGRLAEAGLFADALTRAGLPEDQGVTFPTATGPALRIDHIFVSAELVGSVRRAWIDDDADGSDHQPVWADIELA